jgi:hypothetical protein
MDRVAGRSVRRWLRRRPARVWAIPAAAAVVVVALVVAAVVVLRPSSQPSRPLGPAPIGSHGYDVSWPQCSGSGVGTMPPARPPYLLLGLTHADGLAVNPCLAAQLAWARNDGVRVGAYLVVSYPSAAGLSASAGSAGSCGSGLRCRLREYGAAQAGIALGALSGVGLRVPRVWLDVEVGNENPWSRHAARNIAVLRGVVTALRAAGQPVGVYTTPAMWTQITRGWRLPVPNWLPSGDGRPHHAARLCRSTATGGVTWLVQYTRTLDSDLTCPVLAAVPGKPGPLWAYRDSTVGAGSSGPAVRAVQSRVATPVTGSYSPTTTAAVKTWQSENHLPVSGTVTPQDWRALGADQKYGGRPLQLARFASSP